MDGLTMTFTWTRTRRLSFSSIHTSITLQRLCSMKGHVSRLKQNCQSCRRSPLHVARMFSTLAMRETISSLDCAITALSTQLIQQAVLYSFLLTQIASDLNSCSRH